VSVSVRYHCPRCGAVATVERPASMADRSVTAYPFPSWTYTEPKVVPNAADDPAVDGIRFVCGAGDGVTWDGPGCGEPFYLSFVRFEDGQRVESDPVPERVDLAGEGPPSPNGPGGTGPPA
jgi:hypothetical protein